MSTEPFKPIVVHEWDFARIALLFMLAVGIGVSLIGVSISNDLRSKATTTQPSPSPLAEVVIPPVNLPAPYIRLVAEKSTYQIGDKIAVGIFIDTAGKPVVEADVVFTYPLNVLEFDKTIVKEDFFKSIQISGTEKEPLVSFFVTPTTGQEPVTTQGEIKIGTLSLKAKVATESAKVDLSFDKNKPNLSALVLFAQSRADPIENILNTVGGVTISVQ